MVVALVRLGHWISRARLDHHYGAAASIPATPRAGALPPAQRVSLLRFREATHAIALEVG
jgi:hypothetical protein